jgi:hypothetical protein
MVKRNAARWIRALKKYNCPHGGEKEEEQANPKEAGRTQGASGSEIDGGSHRAGRSQEGNFFKRVPF